MKPRSRTAQNKVEKARARLKECDMDHGVPSNAATVYGHHGSRRNCIRLRYANVWVYDPAWERA